MAHSSSRRSTCCWNHVTLRQLRTSRVRCLERARQLFPQRLQAPLCAKRAHTRVHINAHASDRVCWGCLRTVQMSADWAAQGHFCCGNGNLVARTVAQLRSLSDVLKRMRSVRSEMYYRPPAHASCVAKRPQSTWRVPKKQTCRGKSLLLPLCLTSQKTNNLSPHAN